MLAKAHARAHLQAVVQNIEMTQGRALRVARGAASKLNIDRIIRLQGCGDLRHAVAFGGAAHRAHLVEIEHARCFFAAHTNDAFQMRDLGRHQLSRGAFRQLRHQSLQHFEVLAGLEGFGSDHRLALDFVERVLQFIKSISRVDTHHNRADLGRGELRQTPLHAIG